jgi:hypothetical protein
MRPLLVPMGRGGASDKALATGAALRAGGAGGVGFKSQEIAVSSESFLAPQHRRHYGRWFAVGILAALLALLAAAFVKLAGPAKFAYGLISGQPSIPGCNTAVAGEATVGPLWYRLVRVGCPDETTMHFVYVKRGSGPGFVVFPALMSIGDPVPVSLGQRGADDFEIVLEKPLADGRASLPIEFDRNGYLKEIQLFDHGRRSDFKSLPVRD